MEGIEQLDLYYSTYLPQFFFSMIAPILLFRICVGIDWRTSLVLLACVPLIPVSIVAVSKYAKKIFAKYWGKYTSMGDAFLDSVQGLEGTQNFPARTGRATSEDERERGGVPQDHDEGARHAARQHDHHGLWWRSAARAPGVALCRRRADESVRLAPAAALFLVLVAVEFFLPLALSRLGVSTSP